jgi:hypothetical protein
MLLIELGVNQDFLNPIRKMKRKIESFGNSVKNL